MKKFFYRTLSIVIIFIFCLLFKELHFIITPIIGKHHCDGYGYNKIIEQTKNRTEYYQLIIEEPSFNRKEIVKISEPCEFVRSGYEECHNPALIANSIFLAGLECSKTNTGINQSEQIQDYIFDTSNGSYAVKLKNTDSNSRVSGDGILEGNRMTGKHLMFISLIQSGNYVYMTHGTGP